MQLSRGDLLFLYFLCQFNPLTFYFIASSRGYDITADRYFISLVVSVVFFSAALLKGYKLLLADYIHLSFILALISGRILLDFTLDVNLDISTYTIFAEYALVYLVVAILHTAELPKYFLRYKNIILAFMLINFLLWVASIIDGTSWGVFRAYISGVTINRLPDFMNVMFIPWIFATSGWMVSSAVILYAISTSYRSIYLAILVSVFLLLLFGHKSVRRKIFRNSVISILSIIFIVTIHPDTSILLERVLSLFSIEANVAGEASKSQRVSDFFVLLNSLPYCLSFGCGSVEPETGISFYNFPYYPIWSLLVFGPFGLLFSLWMFLPVFIKRVKQEHNFLLSIWAVLLLILLVFPYLHYFCLMFFIAMLQVPIVRGKV